MKTDVYEKEATDRRRFGDKPGSWKPGADQAEVKKKWKPRAHPGLCTRLSTPW